MLALGLRSLDQDDSSTAESWLERALRAGVPTSLAGGLHGLQSRLEEQRGLTDMWVRLAESQHAIYMYNAGLAYWKKEQLADAERWWRRGAEQGDGGCCNNVGMLRLQAGDHQEADRWFRRGAKYGNAVAMFNVAIVAYQQGAIDEAERWFRQAHEAGYERGADALRHLQAKT